MRKLTMRLETLTCPTCVKKIEGAILKQKGVASVRILFNSSRVDVQFDETKVTEKDLEAIITKLGYTVKSLQTA